VLSRAEALKIKETENLLSQGVVPEVITYTVFLNLRYEGTDTSLMIQQPEDGDFVAAFSARHKREFSFISKEKRLIVDGASIETS
jgi:5-oxoprolinase (ATP-hydrolysing)